MNTSYIIQDYWCNQFNQTPSIPKIKSVYILGDNDGYVTNKNDKITNSDFDKIKNLIGDDIVLLEKFNKIYDCYLQSITDYDLKINLMNSLENKKEEIKKLEDRIDNLQDRYDRIIRKKKENL
jgi:hypothetical protein